MTTRRKDDEFFLDAAEKAQSQNVAVFIISFTCLISLLPGMYYFLAQSSPETTHTHTRSLISSPLFFPSLILRGFYKERKTSSVGCSNHSRNTRVCLRH